MTNVFFVFLFAIVVYVTYKLGKNAGQNEEAKRTHELLDYTKEESEKYSDGQCLLLDDTRLERIAVGKALVVGTKKEIKEAIVKLVGRPRENDGISIVSVYESQKMRLANDN